ncbi:hypothetical protein JIR001_19060 [Polycladomyces abyssicola]|uniref:Uncharacterized protein n=1 Tax=Polycladomyces abyssicola TaxID=1125966 RepID=A0A8D5UG74_9BACL|nr:hypothetical protein JIR001_19060 [Polycladomyces abyssicola]
MLFRYSGAVILYTEHDACRFPIQRNMDRTIIWVGELYGILEQIQDDLFDSIPIESGSHIGLNGKMDAPLPC